MYSSFLGGKGKVQGDGGNRWQVGGYQGRAKNNIRWKRLECWKVEMVDEKNRIVRGVWRVDEECEEQNLCIRVSHLKI